jgi:hypothetical protein
MLTYLFTIGEVGTRASPFTITGHSYDIRFAVRRRIYLPLIQNGRITGWGTRILPLNVIQRNDPTGDYGTIRMVPLLTIHVRNGATYHQRLTTTGGGYQARSDGTTNLELHLTDPYGDDHAA